MDTINFVQTGGFPVKAERLQEMQTAYTPFNKFGDLAGNLTIVSGCTVNGINVTDGFVYINGELLKFKGGFVTENVIIIQNGSNKEFENGEIKTVHFERYVTFGTNPDNQWAWVDFKRPFPTKDIPSDLLSQLEKIDQKAAQTALTSLTQFVTALASSIPKIQIINGTGTVTSRALGYLQDDYSKNYYDIAPPSGYNMSHLVGFMPSIAQIEFSGDVNSDDTLWCKWRSDESRIRVICSDSETRASARINYLAIWIKY